MVAALATTAPVAVLADQNISFDYTFMPIREMRVTTVPHPKTGKPVVDRVYVQDEPLVPTDRFWWSLYSRYGFNQAFFKYFDHAEVFERISKVEGNDRMRLCIERDEKKNGTLLGVSKPEKPIVVYDELVNMLGRYQAASVTYSKGIVESTHSPRMGGNIFDIAGDKFANRFVMATPVDGYGAPNIYLSLLREVCQNGMIGMSKAFRSGLTLGKGDDDVGPSMTRALDGFSSDEGYAALRQRMEVSAKSWASVYEQNVLLDLLRKLYGQSNIIEEIGQTVVGAKNIRGYLNASTIDGRIEGLEGIGSQILVAYHRMTGDACQIYGLANLDALSVKRQRSLPVKCTVYDLINFATEVATHYANPTGARALQGWLGTLLSQEYDMEGTMDAFGSFAEFHTDAKAKVLSPKVLAA